MESSVWSNTNNREAFLNSSTLCEPWVSFFFNTDINCGFITLMHESWNFNVIVFCIFSWKIRIGDFNLGSDSDDGHAEDLDIIEKFVHNKYDGVKSYFDVAILKTKQITRAVSPVCLPQEVNKDIHKYDNHHAELIGWGSSTTSGNVSDRLKRVSLKVFSQE